MSDAEQAQ